MCFCILVWHGRMYFFLINTNMQQILTSLHPLQILTRYTFRNPFDRLTRSVPPCNCSLSFAICHFHVLLLNHCRKKVSTNICFFLMYHYLAHEACKVVSCDGFLHRIPIFYRVCNVLMIHQAINSNCS